MPWGAPRPSPSCPIVPKGWFAWLPASCWPAGECPSCCSGAVKGVPGFYLPPPGTAGLSPPLSVLVGPIRVAREPRCAPVLPGSPLQAPSPAPCSWGLRTSERRWSHNASSALLLFASSRCCVFPAAELGLLLAASPLARRGKNFPIGAVGFFAAPSPNGDAFFGRPFVISGPTTLSRARSSAPALSPRSSSDPACSTGKHS